VRYYKTGGKRYYAIDVGGFTINPAVGDTRNATGGKINKPLPTTYAVLDRDVCHREVGVFTPSTHGGGRDSRWCKRQAEALADELNRKYG